MRSVFSVVKSPLSYGSVKSEALVELKGPAELGWMREAGRATAQTLAVLAQACQAGVSTAELDRIAAEELRRRKARPAFLNYRGFPATLCVSINAEVVHGIPRPGRRLSEGDIVGLDFGAVVRGYYADAAVTVGVGKVAEPALRLIETTREALERGLAAVAPGARIGDISSAVQRHAEAAGYSVVRTFVGHGIGRSLHEDPAVPNYGRAGTGLRLAPGMALAIEPMVNAGGPGVRVLEDGWTAVTEDGGLSAHFEHTVAVTAEGHEVLTEIDGGE